MDSDDVKREFPKEIIVHINAMLTPEDFKTFLFAKNVKLFGGIDLYADDFLRQVLPRMRAMPAGPEKAMTKSGMLEMLNRMRKYGGISADRKARVEEAISEIQAMHGGARKRKERKTKRKSKSQSRRRL